MGLLRTDRSLSVYVLTCTWPMCYVVRVGCPGTPDQRARLWAPAKQLSSSQPLLICGAPPKKTKKNKEYTRHTEGEKKTPKQGAGKISPSHFFSVDDGHPNIVIDWISLESLSINVIPLGAPQGAFYLHHVLLPLFFDMIFPFFLFFFSPSSWSLTNRCIH